MGGHFTAGEGSLETAVKETSEELGLSCDEDSLRFVCTVATTAEGSTPLHGAFVCNEYKVRRPLTLRPAPPPPSTHVLQFVQVSSVMLRWFSNRNRQRRACIAQAIGGRLRM